MDKDPTGHIENGFRSIFYPHCKRRGSIVIPADASDFGRANLRPTTGHHLDYYPPKLQELPYGKGKGTLSTVALTYRKVRNRGQDETSGLGSTWRRSRREENAEKTGNDTTAESEIGEYAKETSTDIQLNKFRVYAKFIVILYRLCKHSSYQGVKGTSFQSWGEKRSTDYGENRDLHFDPSDFRVGRRKPEIPPDCKRVLSLPPEERTERDKHKVLTYLRSRTYRNFTEYSLAMQRDMVSVGLYASFDAERVILRRGHWPINFYFILSGTAVAKTVTYEAEDQPEVVYLTSGDSFGDVELCRMERRQSTVIARGHLELMVLSYEDYKRIFMTCGLEMLQTSSQNELTGEISSFGSWLTHILREHTRDCVMSYFKKGEVLVRDSNATDWIVVIKSGTCSVMKVLHRKMHARQSREGSTADNFQDGSIHQRAFGIDDDPLGRSSAKAKKLKRVVDEVVLDQYQFQVDRDPVLVKIKTLTAPSVFGLSDLFFDSEAGFTVVSDGAHCALVSKQCFLRNVNARVVNGLIKEVQQFPTQDDLQMELTSTLKWREYKDCLLKQVLRVDSHPK